LKQPSLLPLSKDDDQLDDEEEVVLAEARSSEQLPDEMLPHCGMEGDDVEHLEVPYSTRDPGDWVSAGTLDPEYAEYALKNNLRRLRYFGSWLEAEEWAKSFFGDRFKGRVMDAVNSGCPNWAFLIRGPRGVDAQLHN
jgi:hypothetical protein